MPSAFLLVLATTQATAVAAPIDEPNPKAMSRAEIRAFNTQVPRNHPFYIRCVKSADVGSLVARNFSCRTNEQWDKADRVGNQEARDVMEHAKGKMLSGN